MHTLNSERAEAACTLQMGLRAELQKQSKDEPLVAEENNPEPQLCLRCSWHGGLILRVRGN